MEIKIFFLGKIDILQKSFAECAAILLFSYILIMRAQPGALISMKNRKENTNNVK